MLTSLGRAAVAESDVRRRERPAVVAGSDATPAQTGVGGGGSQRLYAPQNPRGPRVPPRSRRRGARGRPPQSLAALPPLPAPLRSRRPCLPSPSRGNPAECDINPGQERVGERKPFTPVAGRSLRGRLWGQDAAPRGWWLALSLTPSRALRCPFSIFLRAETSPGLAVAAPTGLQLLTKSFLLNELLAAFYLCPTYLGFSRDPERRPLVPVAPGR